MASQAFKKGTGGDMSLNMTPMIDCTFQLIIFFILSTQAASSAIARLNLPEPYVSQARDKETVGAQKSVIVNVISAEPDQGIDDPVLTGRAKCYQIEGKDYAVGDIDTLVEVFEKQIAATKGGSEDFFIEIRGDKKVFYEEVQTIMAAATRARIPKMNIAAFMHVKE
ncbi:MAG TPA: biopolymer transporter ExbD [Phycisphaerae bacterium]|nr:biopolymer transporter ExbD [Phycisphaerae bacterium]